MKRILKSILDFLLLDSAIKELYNILNNYKHAS